MHQTKSIFLLSVATTSLFLTFSTYAAEKTKSTSIACPGSSLADEIAKLDRTVSNTVQFSGNCVEDIIIEGHRDLTLIGLDGASITATAFVPNQYDAENNLIVNGETLSTDPLFISRSKVTIESITINGGKSAALCDNRSDCVFRDVAMLGGHNGLAVQSQSSADVIGSTSIADSVNIGIGVFGNSSVNIRPAWANGYVADEAGYTISGHGFAGVLVQDGSFFRSDNADISENTFGVYVRRGAIAKLLSDPELAGINDNAIDARIQDNSTAQDSTPIRKSLQIGALTSAQVDTSLIAGGVQCRDDTARATSFQGAMVCPAAAP